MKHGRNSSLVFSLNLMGWAFLSVIAIFVCLSIVLRLDIAFLESQGMIKNDELRSALYMRALDIEPAVLLLMLLSLGAVAGVSFMFSRSQFGYFGRLQRTLNEYASTGQIPPTSSMGQFNPYLIQFLEIANMRTKRDSEDKIQAAVDLARKGWPTNPKIHWFDQAQFLAVSAVLAIFFNTSCIIFYLQASNQIVSLANSLVRFTKSEAPYFFSAQFEIVSPLMWTVLGIVSVAFIITGVKFGMRFSEASYAILRDLGKFMEGDLDKRLFLRTEDPGRELVEEMNYALDRIAGQIRAQATYGSAEADSRVKPIRPSS